MHNNDWEMEDEELPIWVRKAVASHKRKCCDMMYDTHKTFFGKHNVYKFEWPAIEQGRYAEFWTVEKRRFPGEKPPEAPGLLDLIKKIF